MSETHKAHARRLAEGWFERFCPADRPGLDVGCGGDAVHPTFRQWDLSLGHGDATFLAGVADGVFWTVYASHVLEHVHDPLTALRNWWRVLRPGGHLCLSVPDVAIYEGKLDLPSRWNGDHKTYWRPESPAPNDGPHVRGLKATLAEAVPGTPIVYFRLPGPECVPATATEHAAGEYSIEAVVRKPL